MVTQYLLQMFFKLCTQIFNFVVAWSCLFAQKLLYSLILFNGDLCVVAGWGWALGVTWHVIEAQEVILVNIFLCCLSLLFFKKRNKLGSLLLLLFARLLGSSICGKSFKANQRSVLADRDHFVCLVKTGLRIKYFPFVAQATLLVLLVASLSLLIYFQ